MLTTVRRSRWKVPSGAPRESSTWLAWRGAKSATWSALGQVPVQARVHAATTPPVPHDASVTSPSPMTILRSCRFRHAARSRCQPARERALQSLVSTATDRCSFRGQLSGCWAI
jgi:hypothetical protein